MTLKRINSIKTKVFVHFVTNGLELLRQLLAPSGVTQIRLYGRLDD